MSGTSLIVLQHGLWGSSSHMKFIEKSLQDKFKDKNIVILNSTVNEGKYTYDGVDICGERLAKKIKNSIKELAKKGKKVNKINVIGYSLGGLILRYSMGLLYQEGFFDKVKPGFFVTFATPHIGVRHPRKTLFAKVFNFCSGFLVSRTGEQLQLIDNDNSEPLLSLLATPEKPYYQALSKFETIRTYANIINDRTVPYWTAAFLNQDYFEHFDKVALEMDQDYPAIITGYDSINSKKTTKFKPKRLLKKARKLLFYILIPLLFPIYATIIIVFIGGQGVLSRLRVKKLLEKNKSFSYSSISIDSDSTVDQDASDDEHSNPILSATLDAMNITPDDEDEQESEKEHKTIHTSNNWCNVEPSEPIKKYAQELPFDNHTLNIQKNLNTLPWQKVLVCLHTFNAHGSIVCRQSIHTNDHGRSVIKHFVDTISI
ncbi:putative serine esterase-domain-containing protein [Cunninghamella echinulata]|nr:putative serine esterase-domain-containing protein [Cunninghamella echinulata]